MMDTLIIGSGYLGSCIKAQIANSTSSSLTTEGDLYFRLEDGDFSKLPITKNLIITCSIEHMGDEVKAFSEFVKEHYQNVILISTASLFSVGAPDAIIDENTPLKAQERRVINEAFFEDFASILHLGLLWDKELRKPKKWLPRIKNGNKYVNLCSTSLVAEVCDQILQLKNLQGHFICCDGKALRWNEIAKANTYTLPCMPPGLESKILCPKKLQSTLKSKINWKSYVYL